MRGLSLTPAAAREEMGALSSQVQDHIPSNLT